MSSVRSKVRALVVVPVLVAIAVAGALVLGTPRASSDEPSKPGPALVEGAGLHAAPAIMSVPVQAPRPAGMSCPESWSYFDNPVMHYGMCVPSGWGFSDFSSATPMEEIPTAQLENLHLLGNAFPWTPGHAPFDAVRSAGALDVELDLLPAGQGSTTECEPSNRLLVGLLTFLTCEQRYNDLGLPSIDGSIRALKVEIPLQSRPADGTGDDLSGTRLLVFCRSRAWASPSEVTTLWQIVRSIHPY